jgi:tetratricopeptide (TPR) repeat protein
MIRIRILILCLIFSASLYGQRNCNWYLYNGENQKYEACIAAEKRADHYQFSKEFQIALDEALKIDSTYAPAYTSKSAAYLKSGDFITWNYLMSQAVKYDPADNLGDRGWCRFKFFGDYEGAINDLLQLKSIKKKLNEMSGDGDYHLDIVLALCYKSTGQTLQAIEIMVDKLSDSTHNIGLYDHLHLGVMYLEIGAFQKAIKQLKLQEGINDLAENRFYIAIAFKSIHDNGEYIANLNKAKTMYQNNKLMFDPYVEQVDKIYLSDILNEEKNGLQQQITTSKGFVLRRTRN